MTTKSKLLYVLGRTNKYTPKQEFCLGQAATRDLTICCRNGIGQKLT